MVQVPGADRNSQMGPFKKKALILAVLETDGRTHATAALGRVVIDLSEFASIDGQELRTFTVACNKAIHAAVGEPQLTVTIRYIALNSHQRGTGLQQSVQLKLLLSNTSACGLSQPAVCCWYITAAAVSLGAMYRA
eukprot:GHUV01043967.1.p1 GENE.GHUV01043967.1~~GHUV01043967.1.p1  ORF type:complete len:136 (-),score=36.34 GHUV01043967.1:175-582(-)